MIESPLMSYGRRSYKKKRSEDATVSTLKSTVLLFFMGYAMLIFDCYLLAAILLFCSAALLVKLFLKDWFRKSQSSFVQTLPDTYGTPITSHPAMSDSFSAPAIRDLEW